eukprot:1160432-Pelagomonas_calceolata.AAC.7
MSSNASFRPVAREACSQASWLVAFFSSVTYCKRAFHWDTPTHQLHQPSISGAPCSPRPSLALQIEKATWHHLWVNRHTTESQQRRPCILYSPTRCSHSETCRPSCMHDKAYTHAPARTCRPAQTRRTRMKATHMYALVPAKSMAPDPKMALGLCGLSHPSSDHIQCATTG